MGKKKKKKVKKPSAKADGYYGSRGRSPYHQFHGGHGSNSDSYKERGSSDRTLRRDTKKVL